MNSRSSLILVIIAALGVTVFAVLRRRATIHDKVATTEAKLHPLPASPFQNTHRGTYVGSSACIDCHQDSHDGYRQSGMGQSAAPVGAGREPAGGAVDHPPSGRHYQIENNGSQVIHREFLSPAEEDAPLLEQQQLTVRIGSGRYARTYLADSDGFLVQSPVTWYERRKAWGMSPGYDAPDQQGFERAIGMQCLRCHVGAAEPIAQSFHRIHISEYSIGCERCHGPGSVHIARHANKSEASFDMPSGIDNTIVNPAHLNRDLSVDVCAQCHRETIAAISVLHRSIDDFRPGLPLDAFQVTYTSTADESQMRVVGHVDQLKQSRCFIESKISCITCHDPHALPPDEYSAGQYNANCLDCHTNKNECTEAGTVRQATDPADNCVECHMPTSSTEVPHVAFTHHRIGIHADSATPEPGPPQLDSPPNLVPAADLSWLNAAERDAMLGMACVDYASLLPQFHDHYQQQGYLLLKSAWNRKALDDRTASVLALLAANFGDANARRYIEFARSRKNLDAATRINLLLSEASALADGADFRAAAQRIRKVTQLQRSWQDWRMLAQFEARSGDEVAAAEALEYVLQINPFEQHSRRNLLEYYARIGDVKRRDHHAHWLQDITAATEKAKEP